MKTTKRSRRYRRVPETEQVGITARYRAGEPLETIARQHRIGRDTVREIAIRNGAKPRPVGRPRKDE